MISKSCTVCGEEKVMNKFSPDKRCKDGRYSSCKECCKDKQRQNYAKHPEKFLTATKKWRKNNPEKIKKLNAIWRENNLDYVKLVDRARTSARRATKRLGVSSKEVAIWIKKQDKVCFWCKDICSENFHIDHYIPLARGGVHEIDNLVVSCPSCNMRKHAKLPEEFMKYVHNEESYSLSK